MTKELYTQKVEKLEKQGLTRSDAQGVVDAENAVVKSRLEYLRGEIDHERISYSEIAELVSLSEHIEPDDVQLLEWAGVPEV